MNILSGVKEGSVDLKTWKDVGEAAAVTILGGMLGIQKWREKKARRNGLLPNPKRCEKHEERLTALEKNYAILDTKVEYGNKKLDEIGSDMKGLIQLHLTK